MNRIEEIRQEYDTLEVPRMWELTGDIYYSCGECGGAMDAHKTTCRWFFVGALLAEIDRLNAIIEEIRPQAQEE